MTNLVQKTYKIGFYFLLGIALIETFVIGYLIGQR